jgi:carbon storage regulator CsrA
MKDIRGTLLLSRKEGESIIVETSNEKIIINLEKLLRGSAKIRISAPKDVIIHREEIYKKQNCIFNVKKS